MLNVNQEAIYSEHDIFYKDVVNKSAALRWHHIDGIVILTKTASAVNSKGQEIGQSWYTATRATFWQHLKARLNLWDWWPWEYDL